MSYAGLQRCRCGSPLAPPSDGLRFQCPGCKCVYDFDWNYCGTIEVAIPGNWETQPWEGTCTAVDVKWTFSKEDLERLSWGFKPRRMEDKWYILMEDDEVRFYRSWSGTLCYVAHLSGKEIRRIEIASQLNSPINKPEFVRWLIDRFLLGQNAPMPF
jgi:hypothetical protein